jgi:uncharacterized protein
MNPNTLLAQPLSEAEIDELDRFLCSDAAPEEAMDLSMMNGFITAVASGPNLMMPSTMLRWIWDAAEGIATPTFVDQGESARILGLIIRHWNDVNTMLNEAPEAYEPLTCERESNGQRIAIIDEWCMGYFRGVLTDHDAWAPLLSEHPEWFATILLYGTEDGWEELKKRQFSDEQHRALAGSLAETARSIHRYWLDRRKEQIARGETPGFVVQNEPLRRGAIVGRNDPCPCGSGKKYKRCHGAGERATVPAWKSKSTRTAPAGGCLKWWMSLVTRPFGTIRFPLTARRLPRRKAPSITMASLRW